MSATQLEGCDLKLARARFHQESLVQAFREWVSENMTLEYAPEITPYAAAPWRLNVAAEIPREFSLLLGDCIQCARAALDYMVYELAILNGTARPRYTQFPISTHVSRYFETGRKQVRLLDPRHRRVIRLLQPYQTEDPEIHTLAVLNRLSNTDKHRLLHVIHSGMTYMAFAADGGTVGFVLAKYGDSEAFQEARAYPNTGAILLADLTLEDGLGVLGAMYGIVDLVQAVIDWFRPVFAENS